MNNGYFVHPMENVLKGGKLDFLAYSKPHLMAVLMQMEILRVRSK
jgi:hypothetical protein